MACRCAPAIDCQHCEQHGKVHARFSDMALYLVFHASITMGSQALVFGNCIQPVSASVAPAMQTSSASSDIMTPALWKPPDLHRHNEMRPMLCSHTVEPRALPRPLSSAQSNLAHTQVVVLCSRSSHMPGICFSLCSEGPLRTHCTCSSH